MPQMAHIRFLTFVLVADARIRASDGDYKGALERCLMTGTFAHHVGDDTFISYILSLAVRRLGYKCMQDILEQAAHDEELLGWLRNELATSPVDILSPLKPLKIEIEIGADLMQRGNVEKLAGILADSDEKKRAEIIKKLDDETLEQAGLMYSERMKSALTVLSTPMPYEQAYPQLKQLNKQLANDFDQNELISVATAAVLAPALASILRILTFKTRTETRANAIKVAIEVLLSRAKSGRLPNTLPADLPKDLFSGKDFRYEKTKDGFVLSCRGKDLDKNETYKYEFKANK